MLSISFSSVISLISTCIYEDFFLYKQCGPGGCMTELCIQLATIMVGKQAMNTVMEMLWP